MLKTSALTPKIFIYLDSLGINSLLSQAVNRLETDSVASKQNIKKGNIKTKVGTGVFLSSITGLPDLSAETELSTTLDQIENISMLFTEEQKLQSFIVYLENRCKTIFFTHLPQAANQVEKSGNGVFIIVSEKFSMPQFMNNKDGVTEINRDQTIAFSIGQSSDDFEYNDSYFNKTHYTFLMRASLSKFNRSIGVMSFHGHDATFFRHFKGEKVPLNVFGYMTPLSKYTYQIKPYAIWIK